MNTKSILNGKKAVVFGAGGSIGGAVAKEFAAEGAEVFLAGRTAATAEPVAKTIAAAGSRADTVINNHANAQAVVNALGIEEFYRPAHPGRLQSRIDQAVPPEAVGFDGKTVWLRLAAPSASIRGIC